MNAPFRPATVNLVEPQTLEATHLRALYASELLCVRVPGFIPPQQCVAMASSIEQDARRTEYAGAPGLGCIQMSLYDIPHTDNGEEKYWGQARNAFELNRKACLPFPYPIDLLRLRLSEIWPTTCDLFKQGGRIAFAGLPRFVSTSAAIAPHHDVLASDIPHVLDAHNVVGQCAANVFLKTSQFGGELELYDLRLSFAEYEARRVPGSYAIDKALLPPPVLRIRPALGDLILFDATKLHSVAAVSGSDTRVTASCFVGLTRDGRLVIWS